MIIMGLARWKIEIGWRTSIAALDWISYALSTSSRCCVRDIDCKYFRILDYLMVKGGTRHRPGGFIIDWWSMWLHAERSRRSDSHSTVSEKATGIHVYEESENGSLSDWDSDWNDWSSWWHCVLPSTSTHFWSTFELASVKKIQANWENWTEGKQQASKILALRTVDPPTLYNILRQPIDKSAHIKADLRKRTWSLAWTILTLRYLCELIFFFSIEEKGVDSHMINGAILDTGIEFLVTRLLTE